MEVEFGDVDRMLRRLGATEGAVAHSFQVAMQKSVFAIEGEAKKRAPVGVSGHLRNSISSSVRGFGSVVVGRVGSSIKDSPYPAVMEFGRRRGVPPPAEALERWVRLQMGVPEADVPGVAFLVARSIGRRGIRGRRYLRQGYEAAKSRVLEYFFTAIQQIISRIAEGF